MASATAAMKKASQTYDDAKAAELGARKELEAARNAVRAAKDRRASCHKHPTAESKRKEAEEAVHKAERSYATAAAKLQRAKEFTPKKERLLKESAAAVKKAEATKLEATKTAMALEVAVAEQRQKDEQAKREFQRLREKQMRFQKQMTAKVAEIKKARQDRLAKKGRATAGEVQAMQAHENRLTETLHGIASKIAETRKELKAHTATGKAKH